MNHSSGQKHFLVYLHLLSQAAESESVSFSFVPVSPIVYYTLDKRPKLLLLKGRDFCCRLLKLAVMDDVGLTDRSRCPSFVSLLKSVVLPLALFNPITKFSVPEWFDFSFQVRGLLEKVFWSTIRSKFQKVKRYILLILRKELCSQILIFAQGPSEMKDLAHVDESAGCCAAVI